MLSPLLYNQILISIRKSYFALIKLFSAVIVLLVAYIGSRLYQVEVFETYVKYALEWNFYSLVLGMGGGLYVYRKVLTSFSQVIVLIILNFALMLPVFLVIGTKNLVILNSLLVAFLNSYAFWSYLRKDKLGSFIAMVLAKLVLVCLLIINPQVDIVIYEVIVNLVICFVLLTQVKIDLSFAEWTNGFSVIKVKRHLYICLTDFLNNSAFPYFYYLASMYLNQERLVTFYLVTRFAQPIFSAGQLLNSLHLQAVYSKEKVGSRLTSLVWFISLIWCCFSALVIKELHGLLLYYAIVCFTNLCYMFTAKFQAVFFIKVKVEAILYINLFHLFTLTLIFHFYGKDLNNIILLYLGSFVIWFSLARSQLIKHENNF